MTYQISSDGIKALKGSEGLRLKAYQDEKGVWTIGYGHNVYVGRCTLQRTFRALSRHYPHRRLPTILCTNSSWLQM